ncbi:peptidoglycan bridge formation glycyltransferase FemA/FemB family protein [Candidatus Microgenomates bacterium]|nr:peptidoglycan bridge formation glycyltransferase FemA/FemB family protein [Candidatus Microgenomates bacterium]
MIRIIEQDYDQATWNAQATHPMQSWEWGLARAKMGIEVIRVGEFEGKHLKNVFQMTLHRVPKTPYRIGYLPRSVFPSQEVVDFLYRYGKAHKLISVKIEPNETSAAGQDVMKRVNHDKRLTVSPTPLFPKWTQTIDLTESEDELLKQMKSKTRYNVRLAQKKGVVVTEQTNHEGFETFIKLYFETTKRQRYAGHNRQYHETIFNTLKDTIAHILIVEYENKPLAAYELFLFNNVLYYPYGSSSIEQKEVMAPNLIMWEAIRFGKAHGATSFDLWGSLPSDYDKDHIWAGFTRFKEGYGAQFTEMIGSFDLVVMPFAYRAFTVVQKIRERML